MAGFENDVLLCSNVNFNPALPKPHTGLITTNGQLIIGSTALNAGGTHLNIGVLTSPDGSITIGYSSPNITLQATGSLPYISLSPYIVGTDIHSGYSTIQAAIDAAHTAGATQSKPLNVYIKPKTDLTPYTENLTLYDGINLIGFSGLSDPSFSIVDTTITINGNITFGQNSACQFSNLLINSGANNSFTINHNAYLSFNNCGVVSNAGKTCFNVTASAFTYFYAVNSSFGATTLYADNGFGAGPLFTMNYCTLSGDVVLTGGVSGYTSYLYSCSLSTNLTCNGTQIRENCYSCSIAATTLTFTGATVATLNYYSCIFDSAPTFSSAVSTSYVKLSNCTIADASTFTAPTFQFGPSFYHERKGWFLRDYSSASTGATAAGFSASQFITKQAGLQTTSGAAQTLVSLPVAAGTSIVIKGIIVGANAGHTDMTGGSYEVVCDGTAAAIVGSPSLNIQASTTGTFAASFSGGNLLIQVTAPSAAAYNWATTYQYQPMVSNA